MKCLVTKLTGAVSDNTLKKIGEMRVCVSKVETPSSTTQKFTVTFNKDAKVEIVGNGYFTDSSLATNNGKSVSITNGEQKDLYVSNGDFEIAITDKYSLTYLQIAKGMYVKDIADFKYSNDLVRLFVNSQKSGGDLSALEDKEQLITLYCNNSSVTGDLSSLGKCTKMQSLFIYNSSVTGDLSSLKEMTNLEEIYALNTTLKGDLSSLSKMPNLNVLQAENLVYGNINALTSNVLTKLHAGSLTGDLAKASSKLQFLSCSSSSFTWSSRDSSSTIFGIEGSPTVTNIDKMLQDLASCQVPSGSLNDWEKVISIKGTRTSASDTAVSTLQSKGYTVSVTSQS